VSAAVTNGIAPERLPGVIGHELRNPLASAVTGAMLARDMVDDGDPRAAALDGVLRDLDRMTDLIDGWLAMARDGAPERRSFAADDLVRAVADRHGAEWISCASGSRLCGNRAMLERALDNLCENARRAGATKVRLAVQTAGDDLLIHVEDDGSGVDPAHIDRIFHPGWSKSGGHGLGLYAVAATVRAHRGAVRCVPLGRGTRFTVRLPAMALPAVGQELAGA
jgi:signal transduction histidine kinase